MQVSDSNAREGFVSLYQCAKGCRSAICSYRILLYGRGAKSKGYPDKETGMIDHERAEQVIRDVAILSWAECSRMRVDYFTRGGALGSPDFIEVLSSDLNFAAGGKLRKGVQLKGVLESIKLLRRLRGI